MNKELKRKFVDEANEYVAYGASDSDLVDFIERIVAGAESELQSLRAYNDELLDQLERFGIPCPPMPVKESNNE